MTNRATSWSRTLRNLVDRRVLVFVDVEASSLERGSWPVEVGIARLEGGKVRSEGRLIRPEPDWDFSTWSDESAAVHGIPLDRLHDEGVRAADAAAWLMRETAGWAVSDAPASDRRWIGRLLALRDPEPGLRLIDFDLALATAAGGVIGRLHSASGHLDVHPAPHRAAGDAARLAAAFRVAGGTEPR